ncbi:taurine ABC transporter substrate-binding protein [Pseudocitrobacter sp. RIT415]|uniref:Taurine transport system substrate-binding protein n=1 Tax=Pseudocitrobacter faecalis TaxID=1398493 RepID=A0ABX9FSI5_9ENTR|nr:MULTISPECIES: glycine betaine ABC transporter substrate-binding protein [Pseudocitrobacter]RAU44764.1 taurine ABC transporter substrate-binding protein [Pseudocitrobacter sp. RIT 415]RBP09350.1 taurine transport system substrate-binding protein [Pseudocitrobacter faecalis]GHD93264.1 taurine ABC transporter substrate-binding protein [Pseudocitrobacter faecalis]
MKKSLVFLLAAGSFWVNSVFADTPSEVRVAYSGGSQVLMLAKADGSLDKALNSKVKWVQFASGADALTYFASNAIDIANFGSSPATAGIVRKLPVEIIGVSGVIASYERLIGKEGINGIKDIEGKRVAYPPNSTAQYALEAAITVNKLDRSKITLLPLRPAEMVAAWKRGDIDAGYVWAPFAQELESAGGHQVFATKELQKAGYLIYNNYVVRKAFAEQYPQVVTAFLRVHQEKVNEFKKDPERASAIVAKEVGAPQTTAANTLNGLEYPTLAEQSTPSWLGNGTNTSDSGIGKALSKTANFLAGIGEIRQRDIPTNWNSAINVHYIQDAAVSGQ